jgi:hypothetical protein
MSAERRTVFAIFGAVAVLLGGGLFYFFKIYQPKQVRAGAQAEIIQWEQRFTAARTCLVGAKPASPKAGEALAVRELSPDPWSRGTCTQLIGKLSRGIADDTGMLQVEHAWMTIDRAAAKVATAFASHVDPYGDKPEHRGESPLPAALDALDQADADLRKVAGMDPPASASLAALPEGELIPIRDHAAAVKSLDMVLMPSAKGVIGFGATQAGQVQLVLTPGADPKVLRVPARGLRAVPDLAWGAAEVRLGAVVGPIDANGGFTTMTNLELADPLRGLLAVGSVTDGLAAYAELGRLVFVRSAGGAFSADKPVTFERLEFAVDPGGRGLVVWTTEDGAMHGQIVRGGGPAKTIELGSGYPGPSCLTATKGWVGGETQFVTFDETGATPHVLPQHELLGCGDSAALLHKFASTHYAVCSDTCRIADLTNARPSTIATLVGDKVAAIHVRDHVIGVWRENAAPQFFALPAVVTPKVAISDGKVIDVLAESADGVVLVRIPATR